MPPSARGTAPGAGPEANPIRTILPCPPAPSSLADHVRAPAELARRLNQIAVADVDEGQPLAVGQRLVTRDGVMRRWDGFVAKGAGAAAAERLLRANRLAQLADELPGLQQSVDAASAERDEALRQMERCRASAEEARHAALAAERDARDAARAIDAAAAALERLEAQSSGLAQRQADLEPVLEAAREAVGASNARSPRCPIRLRSSRTSRRRAELRELPRPRSPTSARKRRLGPARALPIASG